MTGLAVVASGMVTAVGFNAPASLAAMRAGVRGTRETVNWDVESGNHIVGGKVDLPHWWDGPGKLAELSAPAIRECLAAAQPVDSTEIPIILGVASQDRPHRYPGLEELLFDDIAERLGFPHHRDSCVIARGNVSGALAIQHAMRLIHERGAPCCVVAGVDSFLHQESIEAFIQQQRVLVGDTSNGFSPGEAGSAVLIAPSSSLHGDRLEILGQGHAKESATIIAEEPFRGDGLTKAVNAALGEAELKIHNMAYRITDLNGEHYKFKEAMVITFRHERQARPRLFELWHPIEFLGEIGAAIVPCALAVAFDAGQKGYAPGLTALCHFSEDNGDRAALVVRFRPGG